MFDENELLAEDEVEFDMKAFVYDLPEKGDRLFVNKGGQYASCLNYMHDSMSYYSKGYKEAADALIRAMVVDDVSRLDTFVYPSLCLYRQYLELSLKRLIRDASKLLGKPFKGKLGFPTGHYLMDLWGTCKSVLKQVDLRYPQEKICKQSTLDAISSLIKEFSEAGPTSDASRYPVDKEGNPSFPTWTHVQMQHCAEIMGKIANFFEIADLAISIYEDVEQDMQSYYAE